MPVFCCAGEPIKSRSAIGGENCLSVSAPTFVNVEISR